jgi:hypothetical protein
MLAADIRERLLRDPFEPFRIRSSSGKVYDITAPFLVALMRTKVFIAAPNSDRWDELSYLHIAALESMTNGHRPRRGGERRS